MDILNSEGKQNFQLQNMPLWQNDYFELVIFFKRANTGDALKNEQKLHFCKRHLQV